MILTESGINPDKVAVTQFATNQIAEMARDQSVDAFMAVGPLNSKITVGRHQRHRSRAGRAEISPDRGLGGDCQEASAL